MDKLADEMWEMRAQLTRITAERDGLLSEVECLNSNARVQAKLLADTGRERDGLRKALRRTVEIMHDHLADQSTEHGWKSDEICEAWSVAYDALTPSVADADRS